MDIRKSIAKKGYANKVPLVVRLEKVDNEYRHFIMVDGGHRLTALLEERRSRFPDMDLVRNDANLAKAYIESSMVDVRVLSSLIPVSYYGEIAQLFNELNEQYAQSHISDVIRKFHHGAAERCLAWRAEELLQEWIVKTYKDIAPSTEDLQAKYNELFQYLKSATGRMAFKIKKEDRIKAACSLATVRCTKELKESLATIAAWIKDDLLERVAEESSAPMDTWRFNSKTLHWYDSKGSREASSFYCIAKQPNPDLKVHPHLPFI